MAFLHGGAALLGAAHAHFAVAATAPVRDDAAGTALRARHCVAFRRGTVSVADRQGRCRVATRAQLRRQG
eukprot:2197452-Prymnesium_polylepis.2